MRPLAAILRIHTDHGSRADAQCRILERAAAAHLRRHIDCDLAQYARVHDSLRDYSYKYAEEAHKTGMPIVRPLFLVDPGRHEAWENWWTYLYGPDLLVSPVWEKGKSKQDVYLPAGNRWRDAWNPEKTYAGGQTISVTAEPYQLPLFIRVGSSLKPWNVNRLWMESVEIARKKPDLGALEAGVNAWFEKQ
jgi:hypothetical protein